MNGNYGGYEFVCLNLFDLDLLNEIYVFQYLYFLL